MLSAIITTIDPLELPALATPGEERVLMCDTFGDALSVPPHVARFASDTRELDWVACMPEPDARTHADLQAVLAAAAAQQERSPDPALRQSIERLSTRVAPNTATTLPAPASLDARELELLRVFLGGVVGGASVSAVDRVWIRSVYEKLAAPAGALREGAAA